MSASQKALAKVVRALDGAGVPCALGGSGMLCARGLLSAAHVGDWDLAVPAEALAAVQAATAPWLRGAGHRPSEVWATDWMATLDVDGTTVELLGGLALKVNGVRRPVPLQTSGHWQVEGVTVPLAPLDVWYAIYCHYKPEKAAAIAPALSEAARRHACAALGVTP